MERERVRKIERERERERELYIYIRKMVDWFSIMIMRIIFCAVLNMT